MTNTRCVQSVRRGRRPKAASEIGYASPKALLRGLSDLVDRREAERLDVLPGERALVDQHVLSAPDGVLQVLPGGGVAPVIGVALTARVVDTVDARRRDLLVLDVGIILRGVGELVRRGERCAVADGQPSEDVVAGELAVVGLHVDVRQLPGLVPGLDPEVDRVPGWAVAHRSGRLVAGQSGVAVLSELPFLLLGVRLAVARAREESEEEQEPSHDRRQDSPGGQFAVHVVSSACLSSWNGRSELRNCPRVPAFLASML